MIEQRCKHYTYELPRVARHDASGMEQRSTRQASEKLNGKGTFQNITNLTTMLTRRGKMLARTRERCLETLEID